MALSPDGTLLVFSARKDGHQQLYLRPLNRLEATPIAGTDNSNSPFFSPDGQWLGFWTGTVGVGAIGDLKIMRLDGGPPVTLAQVPPLRGATWGADEIIFAATDGERLLLRVPTSGGVPHTLTHRNPNDLRTHSLPHMLPDGRGVLYTIGTVGRNFLDGQIAVMSFATDDTHVVLDHGVDARYVSSGHLVYMRDGTLMAVPFDLHTLRVTGTPMAIVKDVMQAVRTTSRSLSETGAAQFSVSNSGALVYVPGAIHPEPLMSLVWVGRNGSVTPLTLPPGAYGGLRLSPDGKRVALHTLAGGTWIHDLARGGLMAVAPGTIWPTFTPDGKITLNEPSGFVSMPLEGGALDHVAIAASEGRVHNAGSWSPDGQTLLFTSFAADGGWEIRALSRTGENRKVHPSGNTAVNERYPQFSPDGEWFVYSSNARGEEEVFLERYRGAPEQHQISINGGTAPAWSPSGREVFYVTANPDGRIDMMAVDVTLGPRFDAGRPRKLFAGRYAVGSPLRHYDVSRDGRFLMVREPQGPPAPPVTQMVLVLNWFEELKHLATSAR